jgi:hypothetical protein
VTLNQYNEYGKNMNKDVHLSSRANQLFNASNSETFLSVSDHRHNQRSYRSEGSIVLNPISIDFSLVIAEESR